MIDAGRMACWTRRDGARYRYHTVIWRRYGWNQVDAGWAVVDDFGDLVTVQR